jgi:hypothetical protein
VETVSGKCGHLCSLSPRFLDLVICEYCTRDAREEDPEHKPVWVPIRKGETVVRRKLPTPRINKNAPGKTIPLFEVGGGRYRPGYTDPFDNAAKDDPDPNEDVPF